MSALIEKQLFIIIMMMICGLTSGIVLDVFKLFQSRFLKKKILGKVLLAPLMAIVLAYLIGEYSYYCQNGKLTFIGTMAFFVGLWLWYKYFYDIISLGEKNEQKR